MRNEVWRWELNGNYKNLMYAMGQVAARKLFYHQYAVLGGGGCYLLYSTKVIIQYCVYGFFGKGAVKMWLFDVNFILLFCV